MCVVVVPECDVAAAAFLSAPPLFQVAPLTGKNSCKRHFDLALSHIVASNQLADVQHNCLFAAKKDAAGVAQMLTQENTCYKQTTANTCPRALTSNNNHNHRCSANDLLNCCTDTYCCSSTLHSSTLENISQPEITAPQMDH